MEAINTLTNTNEMYIDYRVDAATMNGFGAVYFGIDIPIEGYSACLIVFKYE